MSTQKKKCQEEDLAIESTMKSIEKLLEKLESSETSLDQSLLAFEEGIHLIRKAQNKLSEAEQKVLLLLDNNGKPAATDFSFDEDNG